VSDAYTEGNKNMSERLSHLLYLNIIFAFEWSRQITFNWKSGDTQHAINIGTPEQWLNLFLLILAVVVLLLLSSAFRPKRSGKRKPQGAQQNQNHEGKQ
jgi:hypothetical protein